MISINRVLLQSKKKKQKRCVHTVGTRVRRNYDAQCFDVGYQILHHYPKTNQLANGTNKNSGVDFHGVMIGNDEAGSANHATQYGNERQSQANMLS